MVEKDAIIECPGCGLKLPDRNLDPGDRFNTSGECLEKYYELTYWTLAQHDGRFIHQHAVDTYEAQHPGGRTRPITVAFGLIGLHLALEKGYTGRQVQLAHMKIAERRREWPVLELPKARAELNVIDVLNAGTDAEKERMLTPWSESVWKIWEHRHTWVRETTQEMLFP